LAGGLWRGSVGKELAERLEEAGSAATVFGIEEEVFEVDRKVFSVIFELVEVGGTHRCGADRMLGFLEVVEVGDFMKEGGESEVGGDGIGAGDGGAELTTAGRVFHAARVKEYGVRAPSRGSTQGGALCPLAEVLGIDVGGAAVKDVNAYGVG